MFLRTAVNLSSFFQSLLDHFWPSKYNCLSLLEMARMALMAIVAANRDQIRFLIQLCCRVVLRMFGNSGDAVDFPSYEKVKKLNLRFVQLTNSSFSGSFNLAKAYIQRYFRLIPVTAFLVLFTMTSAAFEDDEGFSENVIACRSNWTKTLTFNFDFDDKFTCFAHTWYLGCDFQLFLLTPFIVGILKKFKGKGVVFCVVVMASLMFYRFKVLPT
jgi:hypothetical protein